MLPEIWKNFNKAIQNSILNFNYKFEEKDAFNVLYENVFVKLSDAKCLGELGESLKEMLKSMDARHPEINTFFYNLLGSQAIEEISEIVEIQNFCNRKTFKHAGKRIKELLGHFSKNFILLNGKTIGDPEKTNCHVRFLEPKKMWGCRSKKKKQLLNANKILPDSTINLDCLNLYHHNSDKTLELKNQLAKKLEIFENLSCNYLASEIKQAIKRLDDELITVNFGFRRITLSTLASIHRKVLKHSEDIYIYPVNEELYWKNENISNFIDLTDNFKCFNNNHPVFDHYGIVCGEEEKVGFLVGERDTKAFFMGYCHV